MDSKVAQDGVRVGKPGVQAPDSDSRQGSEGGTQGVEHENEGDVLSLWRCPGLKAAVLTTTPAPQYPVDAY